MSEEKRKVLIIKWHCQACGCVLGHIEDGNTVRIKRKDLYIEITGGAKITEICYRCGKPNILCDDKMNHTGEVDLSES